jgi:hypothetical protein
MTITDTIRKLFPCLPGHHPVHALQQEPPGRAGCGGHQIRWGAQRQGRPAEDLQPGYRAFDVRAACGLGENYLAKGPVTTEKVLSDPSELHRVKIISDLWRAPRVEYPQEAWDEGIRMMVDIPLASWTRCWADPDLPGPARENFQKMNWISC